MRSLQNRIDCGITHRAVRHRTMYEIRTASTLLGAIKFQAYYLFFSKRRGKVKDKSSKGDDSENWKKVSSEVRNIGSYKVGGELRCLHNRSVNKHLGWLHGCGFGNTRSKSSSVSWGNEGRGEGNHHGESDDEDRANHFSFLYLANV